MSARLDIDGGQLLEALVAQYPNFDDRTLAAALRSGELKLSLHDINVTPEIEQWLSEVAKAVADELDPQSSS